MKYKAYPEYKDSGVDWLEKLPAHWETSKLRYMFTFSKGLTITKENLTDEGVPCVNYGEVHSKYGFEVDPAIHSLKCVSESYLKSSPSALLSRGDLVFADTSEDIEGSGNFTQLTSEQPIFAGYHTIIARPFNRESSRFYAYLLDSLELRTQVRHAVKGVKVFSITQAILRGINVWLPTTEEQKQIANFLDHETVKIDTLIEKQQQLIKLLKEKRLAMVDYALESAKTIRLGNCSDLMARKIEHSDNEQFTPIGLFNRGRGLFHKELTFGKDLGDSDFYYIEDRDLIFSGQFAWEGAVALADKDDDRCVASHRYPIVKGRAGLVDTTYLWAFFSSQKGLMLMNECSRGAAGRNRPLNISCLMKEKIPVPSMSKQLEISRLVWHERRIEAKVKKVISMLEEKRTALISAAVTGKVDVRRSFI